MKAIQSLSSAQLELLTLLIFQQAGASQASLLRLLPPHWDRTSVQQVLAGLVEIGWTEQSGSAWRVPAELQERVARYAWRNWPLPLQPGPRERLSASLTVRELRVALYAGDQEHFLFHWQHHQPDFWQPFDPEWLDWLKPAIAERLMEQRVLSGPPLSREEAAYLEARSALLRTEVRVELAFQALLSGRLEMGERLAAGIEHPSALACLAFAQMQRGEAGPAARTYGLARAELRKLTGRRKVHLEGAQGWLELLALIECRPGEIEKWLSDAAPPVPALQRIGRFSLGVKPAGFSWRSGRGLEGLLEALLLTWQGRPQAEWERELELLQKAGQHWLAAEYASLLGRPQSHRTLGTRSLLAVLNVRAPWEQALESLGKLRSPSHPEQGIRMVWKVEVYRDGRSLTIEPLEQKRGAKGWSDGRPVSLKRLAEDWATRTHLSEADRQICRTIHQVRSGYYGQTDVHIDTRAAAPHLIGHPLVLHRETGLPLVVRRVRPRLQIATRGEDWLLQFHTPADYQISQGRLDILQTNESESGLQSALEGGLVVPPEGQARFYDLLRGLSGQFVGVLPEDPEAELLLQLREQLS